MVRTCPVAFIDSSDLAIGSIYIYIYVFLPFRSWMKGNDEESGEGETT